MTNNLIAAIGDIHGCLEEMNQLIDKVLDWFNGREGKIIFLGDYVDRGPDSKGVIDRLRNWQHPTVEIVILLGNHEELMIQSVLYDDDSMAGVWMRNGGFQTMVSIGEENLREYSQWLEANTVLTYKTEKHFFVHAGVNPSHSMADQTRQDYLWIRDRFMRNTAPYENGIRIVHGHTAKNDAEIMHNRINLDTACCYGEKLTAGLFENDEFVRTISVKSTIA